ncbi:YkgJ family cysteine cluster protein [Lysobacter xanthus]
MSHPCLACGACCAALRVAFHWSEADAATGGATPAELTEPLDPHRVVMRGTFGGGAMRCVALRGEVGGATACSIYALRPSPCRELQASGEGGVPSPQCDRARAAHGLAPLGPSDWAGVEAPLAPA